MPHPIRVVQYGLGPIGLEAARTLLKKQPTGRVALVGAIDVDPEKVDVDLADLLDLDAPTGVVVSADARRVLAETGADAVLHATSSFLPSVRDQLVGCAEAGVHVVSSTEELSYPYDRHPDLAAELDGIAREAGVVFVGTGVNPGYAMDTLALVATGVCVDVQSVRVERVVDAGQRRLPLQQKVGAGMSLEAFEEKKARGELGHVGLRESLLFVAAGLGVELEEVDERLEAVVAEAAIETPFLKVMPGEVAGIHHFAKGYVAGRAVLSLDLKMYVGADEPRDRVQVMGDPPIDLMVQGGIFGDTATVAALVNAVPHVLTASPGLRTMMDLPIPRAFAPALLHPNGKA